MEPNKNNVFEQTIVYNITDLIRVVIGRESDRDVRVTLIVDPFKTIFKTQLEIKHEFYFESAIFAYNFIEIIRKVSEM